MKATELYSNYLPGVKSLQAEVCDDMLLPSSVKTISPCRSVRQIS